jgi:hypothetical protein
MKPRCFATHQTVSHEQNEEAGLDDRIDEEIGRIDGVARIRIADHIRECGMRYTETKDSLRRVHERMDGADKARFTLLMAVIVAALSGAFNLILHFLPNGH